MEDGAVDSDAVDGNGEKIGKRNAPADMLPCDREWNLATDRAGQGDPFCLKTRSVVGNMPGPGARSAQETGPGATAPGQPFIPNCYKRLALLGLLQTTHTTRP